MRFLILVALLFAQSVVAEDYILLATPIVYKGASLTVLVPGESTTREVRGSANRDRKVNGNLRAYTDYAQYEADEGNFLTNCKYSVVMELADDPTCTNGKRPSKSFKDNVIAKGLKGRDDGGFELTCSGIPEPVSLVGATAVTP